MRQRSRSRARFEYDIFPFPLSTMRAYVMVMQLLVAAIVTGMLLMLLMLVIGDIEEEGVSVTEAMSGKRFSMSHFSATFFFRLGEEGTCGVHAEFQV